MKKIVVSHNELIDLLDKYYDNIVFTKDFVETCFKDKDNRKWYAYKGLKTNIWYILPHEENYDKKKIQKYIPYSLKRYKDLVQLSEPLMPLYYSEQDLPKLDEPVKCNFLNFFGCGKKCKTRKNKKGRKKYLKYTKKYRKKNKQF
jgi:hypothetical protein